MHSHPVQWQHKAVRQGRAWGVRTQLLTLLMASDIASSCLLDSCAHTHTHTPTSVSSGAMRVLSSAAHEGARGAHEHVYWRWACMGAHLQRCLEADPGDAFRAGWRRQASPVARHMLHAQQHLGPCSGVQSLHRVSSQQAESPGHECLTVVACLGSGAAGFGQRAHGYVTYVRSLGNPSARLMVLFVGRGVQPCSSHTRHWAHPPMAGPCSPCRCYWSAMVSPTPRTHSVR